MEEREHAMMMVQYLIDNSAPVAIPGVAAPQVEFADVVAPVQLALDQEKRVTTQIAELTRIARDESDFASEGFMQWFLKEQVEEVATMTAVAAVAGRSRDRVADLEAYVRREHRGEHADPTAPPIAGE